LEQTSGGPMHLPFATYPPLQTAMGYESRPDLEWVSSTDGFVTFIAIDAANHPGILIAKYDGHLISVSTMMLPSTTLPAYRLVQVTLGATVFQYRHMRD
jgi:hypothetical protein